MSVKPAADGTVQKRLNFDVPEDLAREFKAYAALQGKSQRELVLAFMQRCLHVFRCPRTSLASWLSMAGVIDGLTLNGRSLDTLCVGSLPPRNVGVPGYLGGNGTPPVGSCCRSGGTHDRGI